MRRIASTLMLAMVAVVARAQSAGGLPAPDEVMKALRESPRLQMQVESVEQGMQRERKRRAGPHEWQIAAMQQQRTEATGQRFDEQEYGLQRAMRWPWKARSTGGWARRNAWWANLATAMPGTRPAATCSTCGSSGSAPKKP
jgi:hypothetical protein